MGGRSLAHPMCTTLPSLRTASQATVMPFVQFSASKTRNTSTPPDTRPPTRALEHDVLVQQLAAQTGDCIPFADIGAETVCNERE